MIFTTCVELEAGLGVAVGRAAVGVGVGRAAVGVGVGGTAVGVGVGVLLLVAVVGVLTTLAGVDAEPVLVPGVLVPPQAASSISTLIATSNRPNLAGTLRCDGYVFFGIIFSLSG